MEVQELFDSFREEIDIPNMFSKQHEKTLFLNSCSRSLFWDYYKQITPKRILYYEDYVHYLDISSEKGVAQKFDLYVGNIYKITHSFNANVNGLYPLYDYLQSSIIWKNGFLTLNPKKDDIIFCAHSPFLLYYFFKYCWHLPNSLNHYEWKSIENGLIPLCEDLCNYYKKTNLNNLIFTQHIATQILGIEYFATVINELEEFPIQNESLLKKMMLKYIKILCLLKYLPTYDLQIIFYKKLKSGLSNLSKKAVNEQRNYLLDFGCQTVLFLVDYHCKMSITFAHAITYKYNSIPDITDFHGKIKETQFEQTLDDVKRLKQYLYEHITPSTLTKPMETASSILGKINSKSTQVQQQFFKHYWDLTNPLNKIYDYMQRLPNPSYQLCCKRYIADVLSNTTKI